MFVTGIGRTGSRCPSEFGWTPARSCVSARRRRGKPVSTRKSALTEHSKIKLEGLGFFDHKLAEIGMFRVQQHVPFAANGGGGYMQREGSARTNPTVAGCPQ